MDQPFLMPIKDVYSIPGRGIMVSGRIERGRIKVNEEIEIVGLRATTKTVCGGIEIFLKQLDEGNAGDNVVILLRGINLKDVERGQVLAKPGTIQAHRTFSAHINLLTKDEGGRHTPFNRAYRPQFYFHMTNIVGSIELPAGIEMVNPGDSLTVTVQLITPLAMEKGLNFAIREGDRTVGSGEVIDLLD